MFASCAVMGYVVNCWNADNVHVSFLLVIADAAMRQLVMFCVEWRAWNI
jgi:hypothetical protein